MEAVELSLAGWLELYNQLSAAERLLAKADATGSAGQTGELRARVERLRQEVDAALENVTAKMKARHERPH